jgi:hypothetical protein
MKTLLLNNNIIVEINQRILTEYRDSYGVKIQISSRYLGRQRKHVLYKTPVRPKLTYGSESRPMRRNDENVLQISLKRILRRIYGPIKENGIWRSRYNHEVHK